MISSLSICLTLVNDIIGTFYAIILFYHDNQEKEWETMSDQKKDTAVNTAENADENKEKDQKKGKGVIIPGLPPKGKKSEGNRK